MAFPASSIVTQRAYQTIKGAANQLRINLPAINARLSANGATYEDLRDIYNLLKNANAQFDALKTTPGLAQYAKDQEDNQALDIVAEFASMQGAIASALAWMDTNIPVNNRTLKAPADWGEGTLLDDSFTAGQTAGLRTELTAVVAEIS